MINTCANTNTNTTIVTTLSTEVPTLCRFSTSHALGFSDGLVVAGVLVLVSKVPKCLESAEMKGGGWEIGKSVEVCTSQFPKRFQPIWLSTIWKVGK